MGDLISRARLFNKLATIHPAPEANGFKAEIYAVIQDMPTEESEDVIDRADTIKAIKRLLTFFDFDDVDAYDKAKANGDRYALGILDAIDVVEDMLTAERSEK